MASELRRYANRKAAVCIAPQRSATLRILILPGLKSTLHWVHAWSAMTPLSFITFDPQRFLATQYPVLATVYEELRDGRKRSHWMWFVFPQLRGLGSSATARRLVCHQPVTPARATGIDGDTPQG